MQRVGIGGSERLAFAGAAQQYAAQPGQSQPITDMMRLACEGFCPDIRQRASDWLLRNVGVKVVHDGGEDATASETEGFRR